MKFIAEVSQILPWLVSRKNQPSTKGEVTIFLWGAEEASFPFLWGSKYFMFRSLIPSLSPGPTVFLQVDNGCGSGGCIVFQNFMQIYGVYFFWRMTPLLQIPLSSSKCKDNTTPHFCCRDFSENDLYRNMHRYYKRV